MRTPATSDAPICYPMPRTESGGEEVLRKGRWAGHIARNKYATVLRTRNRWGSMWVRGSLGPPAQRPDTWGWVSLFLFT